MSDDSVLARIRRERLNAREPDDSVRDEDWYPGPLDIGSWSSAENGHKRPSKEPCPICETPVPHVGNHIRSCHSEADCGIESAPEPRNTNGPHFTGRRGAGP